MTEKKLHVLQVTGAMNRGGAEVMLMDIYRNISPDVRFDFLVNFKVGRPVPEGDFDAEIRQLGGRILHIGAQWDLGVAKYIREFQRIVREIGVPDVVHIHLNAKCGVIALAARLCGVRKVIAHSHAALKFKGALRQVLPPTAELKLQRLLIAMCATDYWGCSREANASLFYRPLLERSVVINNAVDVEAFQSVAPERSAELRRELGAGAETLLLGNVGRVVRHKRVDFVMDVLKSLQERGVEALFAFAGRGDDRPYLDEIFAKAEAHGVRGRVKQLGDRGDVPAVMSAFDVFVGPAVNEGFGLVAAEAQAAGVPCVLSTGFPAVVDMGLGLVDFIGSYDAEAWADAVVAAKAKRCDDRALIRASIAERGFDARANTRRVEALYRAGKV